MMTLAKVDTGKVVLFQASTEQSAQARRRAERYRLDVDSTADPLQIAELLGSPARGILVLCNYSAEGRAAARAVRDQKGWKNLPVFAVIADEEIDTRVLKQANEHKIELLPTSLPEARRWQKLREAVETCRTGGRWNVCNRRAHFRLPLKAKATLMCEAETIDISLGGIGFTTNQVYHVGDTGKVDIRSLLGDMEELERGFDFEVVSVKVQKQGAHRYLVGARFLNLSEIAHTRLKQALELIEPTTSDA